MGAPPPLGLEGYGNSSSRQSVGRAGNGNATFGGPPPPRSDNANFPAAQRVPNVPASHLVAQLSPHPAHARPSSWCAGRALARGGAVAHAVPSANPNTRKQSAEALISRQLQHELLPQDISSVVGVRSEERDQERRFVRKCERAESILSWIESNDPSKLCSDYNLKRIVPR